MLCNLSRVLSGCGLLLCCFNSLFVGMCFAIRSRGPKNPGLPQFQFPFRRDELCNREPWLRPGPRGTVSIPFSSGCALQSIREGAMEVYFPKFQFPFRRDELCNLPCSMLAVGSGRCFNSLFVGMSFAMLNQADQRQDHQPCFNSLFVGMSFAMGFRTLMLLLRSIVSIPFSSG